MPQHLALQDVADHVVSSPLEQRQAGERHRFFRLQQLSDRRIRSQHRHHRARRHDVLDQDRLVAEHALQNSCLVRVQRPPFRRHGYQGRHLRARNSPHLGAVRHRTSDQAGQEQDRLQQHDQHADRASHEAHQLGCVDRADSLRNDLRDYQHEHRQDAREHTHPGVAEDHRRLCTSHCRSDSVGNRVEGQNGADRVVDVLQLESEQDLRTAITFVPAGGELRSAAAEQCRFQDRAQERDREGDQHREQQHRQPAQTGSRSDREIER